jgi:hypothetical protein
MTWADAARLLPDVGETNFIALARLSLGINDGERTANALRGIEGKRLTYPPGLRSFRRSRL